MLVLLLLLLVAVIYTVLKLPDIEEKNDELEKIESKKKSDRLKNKIKKIKEGRK